MQLEDIRIKVRLAVQNLFKNDLMLLENNTHERTITAHLANYMIKQFPGYNIDCEYNRNVECESLKKEIYSFSVKNGNKGVKYIYPDIIIHERGSNDKNLLIVEVKKTNATPSSIKNDHIKLKKSTTKMWSNLNYCVGVFLLIGEVNGKGTLEEKWFINGKEIN